MKMSKMYLPTLREVPAEAEIPSHRLLLRSGMTRRLVSGIYSYLPLGYRVIRKVEDIIREEMDNFGGQELLMSAVQPKEIWEATGRWEDFGPEMFKIQDRHARDFCLGPTHEEYLTDMIKGEITSYKQLPLILYQIQTKYRDELRPRFGFMRAREFIMKDSYTFDVSEEAMKVAYQNQWDSYDVIFSRFKMRYKVVQGDSGAMGGDNSHEFMAMSEHGESLVAYCNSCDYAATDEKAEVAFDATVDEEELEVEKIYTPGASTVEDLKEYVDKDGSHLAKSLVYSAAGEPVVCVVPGNRHLSEIKLVNHLGIGIHELEIGSDQMIIDITGAEKGYTGPIGIKEGVTVLIDSRITQMKNMIVGANEVDHHFKNVNFGRDFTGEVIDDLLLIEEGDICPECGEVLKMERGIEVGNIFQLGTKYSDGLNATFLDENGRAQKFWMGSYGIGVSRTVSAIIEQHHDENGIIWPMIVAPYHAIITIINTGVEEQVELGEKIYKELKDRGVEVLLDDRDERAGVKFNDRDLIGIPIRITVGRDASEGIVEYSLRSEGVNENVKFEEIMGLVEEEFEKNDLKI